jgi:hypothetical protein
MESPGACHSHDDAERLIKEYSESGELILTIHFRRELEKEDLSITDVQVVIRRGYVFEDEKPEYDTARGNWKYRISGTTTDGEYVTIVFCLNPEGGATLITVFSTRSSRK